MPLHSSYLTNERHTADFAAGLAARLRPGDCLALSGDLGAGKTAFARAVIRRLAGDVQVTSPTFTLVQSYPLAQAAGDIWHADLYRLKEAREFVELGYEEAETHVIALIEWPERAEAYLSKDRLTVRLQEDGPGRRVTLESENAEWQSRLADFSCENTSLAEKAAL